MNDLTLEILASIPAPPKRLHLADLAAELDLPVKAIQRAANRAPLRFGLRTSSNGEATAWCVSHAAWALVKKHCEEHWR